MLTVRVLLFASLREAVGQREIEVSLADGATMETLRERVGEQYPAAQGVLRSVVCAVDEEYVRPGHQLRDGDRVALIPPVSGGC